MRHGKKINHLGRTKPHRDAMLSNMASSLILHKRINTTVAKAKSLRKYVEPLLTKAKTDTTHSRRVVFSYLQNKESINELFREVAGKIANRPGGYTRILKTGKRLGDNADMCLIELVDYNENMLPGSKTAVVQKTRRSRRSGDKKEVEAKKTDSGETKALNPASTVDKKSGVKPEKSSKKSETPDNKSSETDNEKEK